MGKLLLTILSLLGVTVGLMFAVYFGLNVYTKHGQNQNVPDIKGKSFYEAKKELNKNNYKIRETNIDIEQVTKYWEKVKEEY